MAGGKAITLGAESSTQCLAGEEGGLCLHGHNAEHGGCLPSLGWGQMCSESSGCRDRQTVLRSQDLPPHWSQLTAPGRRLPEGSGVHALAAD